MLISIDLPVNDELHIQPLLQRGRKVHPRQRGIGKRRMVRKVLALEQPVPELTQRHRQSVNYAELYRVNGTGVVKVLHCQCQNLKQLVCALS